MGRTVALKGFYRVHYFLTPFEEGFMSRKICAALMILGSMLLGSLAWAGEEDITEKQVIDLVNLTADAVAKDTKGTIDKINKGSAPFTDEKNKALYTFMYDPDVNMIAHPQAGLVGKNFKGKPDAKGKNFRDDIVKGALSSGTGWVDYLYQKPGEKGIHPKKTYYKIANGNDGKKYIICAGMYDKK